MTIIVQTDDNVNFQTLGGLKDSISARLDREFDASDIDDFIYLAEREMERVLLVPYRETYTTLSISASIESLPSAFKRLRRLTLLTDPKRMLEPVTPAVLDSNWTSNETGCPEVYSIIGDSLHFAPAPDAAYTASIVYEAKITPLTEAAPSNWLFDRHPDAYFYGALVQAADFIEDTKKIDRYRAMFDMVIGQINAEGNRYRYSASPMRLRSPVVA